MTKRRVVITGVGFISSLGIGREEYFAALQENRSGIARVAGFDAEKFPCKFGSEAPALRMPKLVPKAHRKATKLMSRDIELAVVAADTAVRDAGLKTKGTAPDEDPDLEPTRSGVDIGAGLICCDLVELAAAAEHGVTDGKFDLRKWGGEGMNSLTPLWLLKYLPNMLNCHVSIIHDLQGPSNAVTCGEASGQLAVGEAARLIATGKVDLMVAGGAECKVNPMATLRQILIGRLTEANDDPAAACRPFDRGASGSVLGEGGGIVILEELDRAVKRGATIYAEVTGFGASYNLTDDYVSAEPGGTGVAIALKKALTKAGVTGEQVQLLIPHGLAAPEHDQAEVAAIESVFGDAAKTTPIFLTKSRVGNCGAGAGALDLATAALCMREGVIPGNINCDDPIAPLSISPTAVETDITNAVVCAHTYGGQTAAVVLSKFKQ